MGAIGQLQLADQAAILSPSLKLAPFVLMPSCLVNFSSISKEKERENGLFHRRRMSTALKAAMDDISLRMATCGPGKSSRRRPGPQGSSRDSAVAELQKQLCMATQALDLEY